MECEVCKSKRQVKFSTKDIDICQWCINELLDNPVSRGMAQQTIMKIAFTQIANPPKEPDYSSISREAEIEARRRESIGNILSRLVIGHDAIKDHVEARVSAAISQAQAEFNRALEEYIAQKEGMTKAVFNDIVSGNLNPRVLGYFPQKRSYLHSRYDRSPVGAGYRDLMGNAEKRHLRLLRAYDKGIIGEGITARLPLDEFEEIRGRILNRDSHQCVICGKQGRGLELHVHHIIPLTSHGTDSDANLATLCYTCHNRQQEGFEVTRNKKQWKTGGEFVSIDIETTGFSPAADEIIEVAAVRFDGGRCLQKFESLMRPRKKEVPYAVLKMTGIKAVELEFAPSPEDVLPSLVEFVGESKIVGHNINSFDLPFLVKACEGIGIAFSDHDIVDTLPLCRKKLDTDGHKLPTVLDFFRIDAGRSHRAVSDALATGKLYIELLNYSKGGKAMSASRSRGTVRKRSASKEQILPCSGCGQLFRVSDSGNRRAGKCSHCGATHSGPSIPFFYRPKIKGAGQSREMATKDGEQIAARALKRFARQELRHWENFLKYLRQGAPDLTEYRLKKVGSKWSVTSPSGAVITEKKTKKDARIAAVEAEAETLRAAGFPNGIVSCVWAVRVIRPWDPQLFLFEEE